MDKFRKLIASSLILAVLLPVLFLSPAARAETTGADPAVQQAATTDSDILDDLLVKGVTYEDYIALHADKPAGGQTIVLDAGAAQSGDGAAIRLEAELDGRQGVMVWDSESGWIEWTFAIEQAGLYQVAVDYYNIAGKGRDIELACAIDGAYPFDSLKRLTFSRVFEDEGPIGTDQRGNEIRPRQIEVHAWQSRALVDPEGLYDRPFQIYLEPGDHAIRFLAIREGLAIDEVRIEPQPVLPDYAAYLAGKSAAGIQPVSGVESLLIQAEKARYKSHATIYPMFDRGSVATLSQDGSLNDPVMIRLNTIGQYNWQYDGQWASWNIDVPEDGLYALDFRVRQNYFRGMNASRTLMINGEVPFKEAKSIEFPFNSGWYVRTPGEGREPYLFHLKKGRNEIRLEVTLGEMAQTLRTVEEAVYILNTVYRQIIKITGANPDESRIVIDTNRDFYLDKKIPGMIDKFNEVIAILEVEKQHVEEMTGTSGSEAATLDELIVQLRGFIKEPETIPARLERFRSNVSNLGGWILYMREQPLELDYIQIRPSDQKPASARAGIFRNLWFSLRTFLASFYVDYSQVGNVYDEQEALKVWVSQNDLLLTGSSSGRDQTQIIKSLIDDLFTPEYGIKINLSLVDSSSTLTQAVLGKKGPDIAMIVPKQLPVNLAMRNALVDMTQFEGFAEDRERFFASAFIPYEYEGGVFAMPETQIYDMFFYRKDIFAELGMEVPDTWEDFYKLVPIVQKNNMQIGVPESQTIFETLLFQKGGQFYADDRRATGFDEQEALEAFKEWTGFYKKYSFPLVFDFYNRFRTGEMPCGIQPYTMYNLLTVAAPELRNLWDMAPLPGTVQPDGSINRAGSANGTASIILRDCKNPEAAYQFISWWTSEEVQARYGTELEYLMGPAARYATANKLAFERLPWSGREAENLKMQWQNVLDIPQLPGNYYTSRNLSFAFRRVVYNWANERETLNKFNQEINKEIMRKRVEFGLESGG